MAKLSPSLKALIHASFARPGPVPASAAIREVYKSIARDATTRKLGVEPWLVMSTAATITLNSPDSLPILHDVASMGQSQSHDQTQTAELMREVGLKCISFNGIPRTINCLNAFHDALPKSVQSSLVTQPSRTLTRENIDDVSARGRRLWDSVYAPLEEKLLEKLARAHPDLPVHILGCHYGPLLSDPVSEAEEEEGRGSLGRTGRVLTSLLAIACLRAQTGVGPQVFSHVLGLRKAFEDGTWTAEGVHNDADGPASARKADAQAWLAGDQGLEWILRSVDAIAEALGEGRSDHWSRNSKL
ncbi:hypothetical protein E4U17_006084 [Claviceps sp. LM77 group G4]|nr:hypothetical protein E4U17_006084 [Claviceps sp. LM77 group G4]KAG6083629.1 hypothetical protein E4U16_003756 [Claviceps sp. LM84 group G4]KAG6086401.1 hypothetical protein E4U33_005407 [Claviceps sp. LM78 group G4]